VMGDGSPKDSPHSDAPHRIPIEDHIDLHAFSPAEVRDLVGEYLEQAAAAGFREVRIIHGRGTGVQRRIVRSILSGHPRVEGYGDAPPEGGGWGATFVRLRDAGPATSGG